MRVGKELLHEYMQSDTISTLLEENDFDQEEWLCTKWLKKIRSKAMYLLDFVSRFVARG